MQILPTTRPGKLALGLFVLFLVLLVLVLILYRWLGLPASGITGVLGYATSICALLCLISSVVAVIGFEERSVTSVVCIVVSLIIVGAVILAVINAAYLS